MTDRGNSRMNRYISKLAVALAGCMLWGGCGMGGGWNTETGQAVETNAAKETQGGQAATVTARPDGESTEQENAAEKETVGVVFPVGRDPFTSDTAAVSKEQSSAASASASQAERIRNSEVGTMVSPLLEQLFSYETDRDYGNPHLIVTGIAEEYRDSFWEHMGNITRRGSEYRYMLIPADVNGMPVKVIGEEAFAGMDIKRLGLPDTLAAIEDGAFRDTKVSSLELPENLERIGAGAFEGCALERLQLPDCPLTVGERAFAGSRDLWTVLVPNGETVLEDGAFADCREGFLLCYGVRSAEGENTAAEYAREQGLDSMEIILSRDPIVNYPSEPLVLEPELGSFFYGDYEDSDEELWCSWEEAEDAPNFGYIDWQAPGCSSWCGAYGFEQEAEASSELASAQGRYAAENILIQDRRGAWAEGAEGPGIGESLIYRQSCTYGTDNKWEALTYDNREPVQDGFMRYSEICIVNGYAKTQSTWEENGRIKRLLLYVENRPYAYLELADTMQPQYFKLPKDDIKVLNGGMLEARFEILEVYPGSVYEDTCLTGLIMEFTGRYAH